MNATSPAPAGTPNALRVAAVWGTTVVALKTLDRGESFVMGDHEAASLPIPDGIDMAQAPVRAAAGGWELDARGCIGGLLTLRGRAEDPIAIAKVGTPVPIMPGDHGLIQYGQFSIFFQYTAKPIRMSTFTFPEVLVFLALFCSAVLHGGGVLLTSILSTPLPLPKPPELENPEDLASRFRLKRDELEPPPPPAQASNDKGGTGVPNPGPKDNKPAGKGAKAKDTEGKMGLNKTGELSVPGEKPQYGGVAEVLEGETGKEMKKTLESISSVSAALSGINPKDVVMGSGSGLGLKGAGGGGGGSGPTFGTGGVDTGFGGNTGVGLGGGGPGGRGNGGPGKGGAGGGGGAGNGGGPGERTVVAPGAAAARGGLSPDQVRRVVITHLGAVRACYESEAQKNPGLKGGVTIAWTIDPSGAVTGASVAGTTLGNPRVEGCVVRQVQRWKFPASESNTSVVGFPFKFGVGG